MWWTLTSKVTEVDAPVRFEDVQEQGPFTWFRHEHRFETVGGSPRMHDRWEHRSPFGMVGHIVDRLVLARYMLSLLVARNAALKHLAEGAVTSPIRDPRLLVLYDGDCGICSRSAMLLRRLDHDRRLRLVALQDADQVVDAPPLDVLLDAMHVRDRHGHWSIGGAAWIRIAEEVAILRPLAVAARVPTIRRCIESIYGPVARNRHRISHLIGDQACDLRSRSGRPSRARRDR